MEEKEEIKENNENDKREINEVKEENVQKEEIKEEKVEIGEIKVEKEIKEKEKEEKERKEKEDEKEKEDKKDTGERSFFYRYCIVISTSYPKLIECFEKSLKEYDFDIQSFEKDSEKYICISQKNEKRMLKVAEALKIKKPKNQEIKNNESPLLDQRIIDLEKKEYFIADKYEEYNPSKDFIELYELVRLNKKEEINKRYGLGLFTESEMLLIEKTILENIPIENMEEFKELISTEGNQGINKILKGLKIDTEKNIEENSLFNSLVNTRIIDDHFALHISNFSEKIKEKSENPNLIRSYFNDEVALYFSFMKLYTKRIFIPAIISTIIYFYTKFAAKGKTAEFLYFFHALEMTIWAQIFIVFWNRRESSFKVLWGNDTKEFDKKNNEKEKDELIYVSSKNKYIKYLMSFATILIFICIAFIINIASLNSRGLIPEDKFQFLVMKRYYRKKGEQDTSPIYLLLIRALAMGLFESVYDVANEFLTKNEGHRNQEDYYNSYILKKFIFESFNYFFDVVFISFGLRNFKETSRTINFYFYLGKYIKIVFYFVFPLIKAVVFMKSKEETKKEKGKKIKIDNEKRFILGEKIDQEAVIKQFKYGKFNSFSEFYPLMKEFCFLVLFASCTPLAPILLYICNNLNIPGALERFCESTRRPDVIKKRTIGTWKYIIECIGILSIITNIMFCYIYNDTFGETKFSILDFVIGEHILLLVIIAFRFFFPKTEGWVRIYKLRKIFKNREESHIKFKKSMLNDNA